MGLRTLLTALFALAATPAATWACSVGRVPDAAELVRKADLIVRARPTGYAMDPGPPNPRGLRNIAFEVLEALRGNEASSALAIPGRLVDTDDFNDSPMPYGFVRPEGRHGDCFATTYRTNGQFLLFLVKGRDGYAPYWAALAPVNEQLGSDQDPWLLWVRRAIATGPAAAGKG